MHLFGTIIEEHTDIVVQLCSTHDAVVAEHHTLAVKDGTVGYQFHLRHEIASRLAAGCETAWPCGSIFQHGALVRHLAANGIAYGHTYT